MNTELSKWIPKYTLETDNATGISTIFNNYLQEPAWKYLKGMKRIRKKYAKKLKFRDKDLILYDLTREEMLDIRRMYPKTLVLRQPDDTNEYH